jgi:hypothetical protein
VNKTAAVRNVRLLPTRSASRPAGINNAANTIVYAFRIHDSDEGAVEANCALIDGNATNRIVVSRNTANTARLVLAKTTQGFLPVTARSGIAGFIGPPRYIIENT